MVKMRNERLETKYIVIHSSDTSPEKDLNVEDLDTQHRKEGIFSVGFHKIITRSGDIQNGRDIKLSGVHVNNAGNITNANSIGICLVGGSTEDNMPDCNFTFKQFQALVELVNNLKKDYKSAVVVGYRDVADVLTPHFNITELLS